MRDWTLARIIWVADRGFSSAGKPPLPAQGAGGYIIGEKLRSGLPGDQGRPVAPGPLHSVADNLQVKEVKVADRRPVRDLLQPRSRGRATPQSATSSSPRSSEHDRRIRHADRAQARPNCAGGSPPSPASTGSCAPHPAGCCASTSQDQSRGQPGRQVPAALLRPQPVRRGHRPGLQAAARSRTRLARHEVDPRPAPGLPPPRRPHPRPRPAVLARAAAHPHRREPPPAQTWPTIRRRPRPLHPAPSPALPGPSASAPSSPSPPATCSPSSTSTRPARSTNSRRHLTPAPRPRPRGP